MASEGDGRGAERAGLPAWLMRDEAYEPPRERGSFVTKSLLGMKAYDMHELKVVRDYESGKVTKEQLDACSTCDMCAQVNDVLSAASKADAHVYETHEAL